MFVNIKNKYILPIWIIGSFLLFSQNETLFHVDENIILDEVLLKESSSDIEAKLNYLKLKYRVLKVYPYLDSISNIMNIVNNDLNDFEKKRISRRYIRKAQKKIIHDFGAAIKDLTRKEGVVLSKLVHRKFNLTVYDIISTYRGNVHAFFWQRLSRLYDGNLKSKFDPKNNNEDILIEYIISEYVEE